MSLPKPSCAARPVSLSSVFDVSRGTRLMILDGWGAGYLRRSGRFGAALAVGDYNRDGYDDLAVGVPGYDLHSKSGIAHDVGVVMIYFGGVDGLQSRPCRCNIFREWGSESIDTAEAYDQFGATLTTGDFNRDGYDDLAIGATGEDSERLNLTNNGAVTVLYGGPNINLSGVRHRFVETRIRGNEPASRDEFGATLTAGDFDGDGYADLAIGHPYDDIDATNAGAVTVIFGGRGGLGNRREFWSQYLTGKEKNEEYDSFGYALASADFNRDGHDDLAIGTPYEDYSYFWSDDYDAGQVIVLYGSSTGLRAKRDSLWHQDRPGVSGGRGFRDWFGHSLSIGDYNRDGYPDLLIGEPGEDVQTDRGKREFAGVVHVLNGSHSTLRGNDLIFTQVPSDSIEDSDRFGRSLP